MTFSFLKCSAGWLPGSANRCLLPEPAIPMLTLSLTALTSLIISVVVVVAIAQSMYDLVILSISLKTVTAF